MNDSDKISGSGASRKQKLQGAVEVVHGMGDNLRGRLMSAVDPSKKTGGPRPEVEKGQREVEQGMAKLTGGPGACHPQSAEGDQPQSANHPSSTAPSQEGNSSEPTSTTHAGFNAAPTAAVAHQSRYSATSTAPLQQGSNDRDFHPGGTGHSQPASQQGTTPGPAPDRSTLSGDPQRLG
ncbi:hypothetical protein BN946_scf184942.g3 [Trametes cinnabarina]|uniref:Uncharacterized protein n=1 Tax=Pycnoporus cinnabarinus TaxID=5643 RepID=A0A060SCU0_PYCCI|nr:hypothetical protein BN946_scf184942.g3 [Trametes cinnabarina]